VVPNAPREGGPGESDVSTNGMPGWRANVLSRASAKHEDPSPLERSVADDQER
jgi:hypothetical protein